MAHRMVGRSSAREQRGPEPEEHTEKERMAIKKRLARRRSHKTAAGKHTYQPTAS